MVNEKIKQQLRLWSVRIEVLEWRATREARVNIVPPLQLVAFAELPAEEDDAPVSEGRKVDQTALKVLKLNAETLQFGELDRQFGQHGCIRGAFANSAATLFGGLGCLLRFVAVTTELSMCALNFRQNDSDAGK